MMLLTKRRRDWMFGHRNTVIMVAIGSSIALTGIGVIAYDWRNFDAGSASVLFFATLHLIANYFAIRSSIPTRFPYQIKFGDNDQQLDRFSRMINYCERRKIPYRTKKDYSQPEVWIPCVISFLYEDDLHEANLAV